MDIREVYEFISATRTTDEEAYLNTLLRPGVTIQELRGCLSAFRAARRRANTRAKKRGQRVPRVTRLVHDPPAKTAAPEDQLERPYALNEGEWAVVLLRVEGLTQEEIGEALGLPRETVRNMLRRIILKIEATKAYQRIL